MKKLPPSFLFPFFSLFFLVQACGQSPKYNEYDVKDYRLFVETDDEQVKSEMRSLVDSYNARSCFRPLQLVEVREEGNSFIRLVKGIQERDQKVGWGQYIVETYEDQPYELSFGQRGKRTYVYSMRIDFDYDYFYERLHSDSMDKRDDLFKLFSHEVGHGFLMPHDPQQESVMYPSISGEKNFEPYFERVRSFFGQPSKHSC